MLAMLERWVTDRRGTYAFCAMDSITIVVTEFGGLFECEGGTADSSDPIEAIRAVTWDDVREIQARFNALNPYDRETVPDILNIEDVNFCDEVQRMVFAFVVSAKRYALYSWTGNHTLRIEKCSDHGLGHLMNPLPRSSPDDAPEVRGRVTRRSARFSVSFDAGFVSLREMRLSLVSFLARCWDLAALSSQLLPFELDGH